MKEITLILIRTDADSSIQLYLLQAVDCCCIVDAVCTDGTHEWFDKTDRFHDTRKYFWILFFLFIVNVELDWSYWFSFYDIITIYSKYHSAAAPWYLFHTVTGWSLEFGFPDFGRGACFCNSHSNEFPFLFVISWFVLWTVEVIWKNVQLKSWPFKDVHPS